MAPPLFHTFFILSATLTLLTPSFAYTNILYSGQYLRDDQYIREGDYMFIMQGDCNLVLYSSGGRAIWQSNTHAAGKNCLAIMGDRGTLEIYDGDAHLLWTTSDDFVGPKGNYLLVMQADGNVVIYGPSRWDTGTYRVGTTDSTITNNSTAPVVIAGDKISMVT